MAIVFLSIRPARKSAVEKFLLCMNLFTLWNTSQIRGKDLILRARRMKDNGNLVHVIVGALRPGSFRLVINL